MVRVSTRPHSHDDGDCPAAATDPHAWCPRQKADSRSPCPALNTLANHGYLPRNGKSISAQDLVHALEQGFGCSTALAYVLSYGGVLLLGQFGRLELGDLARHNRIEHDASLVHRDAGPTDDYAPTEVDIPYLDRLLEDSKSGRYLTAGDIGAARVRREASYRTALNKLHQESARGEMALVLGIFGKQKSGPDEVPLCTIRIFLEEERFPDGWKPVHTQGLFETIRSSAEIRHAMYALRKEIDAVKKDDADKAGTANGVSRRPVGKSFKR